MVQTLAVNENNDLYLDSNGNIAKAEDLQAVLQLCDHAAKTVRGELVLDTTSGIPYFTAAWGGVPSIPKFEAALREALLRVQGVVEVSSLITDISGDVLSYSAVIRTIYGGGAING